MSGTVAGGRKTARTNKKLYGKDYYRTIGAMGGKNGHTGGFYANRELASIAGRKGGTISRRKPTPQLVKRLKGMASLSISFGRKLYEV